MEYFHDKWSIFPAKVQNLAPLLVGQVLGLLLIVMAPGFSSRVETVSNNNGDQTHIVRSFLGALVAFSGASLTIPTVLCAIGLLVFFLARGFIKLSDMSTLFKKFLLPLLVFGILFGMLVIGSTFAYASWHQSLGLIFIGSLLAVIVLIELLEIGNRLHNAKMFSFIVFLVSLVFIFDVATGTTRGVIWDRAFNKNICFVKSGQTQSLLSADLLNPISKLGFEDINTWAWMHQDYVLWLESSKKSCNLV